MRDFLRASRRSSLPPSVQAFDARIDQVETKLAGILQGLERTALKMKEGSSDQGLVVDVLSRLRPVSAQGFAKRRVGTPGDGGYVMLDDFGRVGCALSFGIEGNDDWDLEVAESGIDVRQFDHTIERAPSQHSRLHFEPKKVGVVASPDVVTLPGLLREADGRVLLKMDIEGDEWSVFEQASSEDLDRCIQIACEFHHLSELADRSQANRYLAVLAKLERTHAVVHVHANNWGELVNVCNVPVPDVLEVSFAARADYVFEPTAEVFPGPLDMPNRASHPDIMLGRFVFR